MMRKCYSVSRSPIDENNDNVSNSYYPKPDKRYSLVQGFPNCGPRTPGGP